MRPLKLVIGVLLPTRDRHGCSVLSAYSNLQKYVKTRDHKEMSSILADQ
jgi:hypothetical protein